MCPNPQCHISTRRKDCPAGAGDQRSDLQAGARMGQWEGSLTLPVQGSGLRGRTPGALALGSQAFPLPDSPPHLLPLPCLSWAFSECGRQRGQEDSKREDPVSLQRSKSVASNSFPQIKSGCTLSWHRDPTPPTRGQGRYCSPVGTRCRTQPRKVGGAGTGLVMACQVPGSRYSCARPFTCFNHQSNCGREHNHSPH